MIVFPNAKINLGLNILSKRPDNYHNIETVFYPFNWQDALEIIEAPEFKFSSSGIEIDGPPEKNLCTKAFNIIQQNHQIPNAHIHLHKVIPMGAGLGGGSADAAFTLKTLNTLFNLNLSVTALQNYASLIGADCAFFIENKPVIASEKGNVFKPISIDLSAYHLVVVYPNIHVSTQEAYAGVRPAPSTFITEGLQTLDFELWRKALKNDFEPSVFAKYPAIEKIKNELYQQGALYASMSGSGAAVFGIFENKIDTKQFNPFQVWQGKL